VLAGSDTLSAGDPPAIAHVDLVAACFAIWGALTMLIGASTLALGIAAASLANSPTRSGQFAAGIVAAAFTVIAVVALIWGAAHVVIGRRLKRRRHWARPAALMVGSVDLILLPFGTVLGAYSLWTLLRDDARRLFDR
jgi:hypothetical protein